MENLSSSLEPTGARPFCMIYNMLMEFTKNPEIDAAESTAKLAAMLSRHANEFIAPLGKTGMDPLSGGGSQQVSTMASDKQKAKQNLSRIVGTTIHKGTTPVSNIDVYFADILANQIKIDHVDALHFLLLAKVRVSQIRPQMNVFRVMAKDYPWLEYQRMVAINQNRNRSEEIANIEEIGLFVVSNARRHYINERQNLFWIIADLMKARRGFHLSPAMSAHKRGVILEFTDKLLQAGFATNIMKTLMALLKRSNELGHTELVEPSQQILCETLTFLYASTQATKEEIQGLLILIKTASELVQRRNQQRRPLALEQNLFTLLSALMYAMVPAKTHRLLGDGSQNRPGGSCYASKHGDVETQLKQYVRTDMAASRAQGSVFLILGLQIWKNRGRAEASSCLREARKRGACRFLESQIRGPCSRFEDADTWMFAMSRTRHVLLQYFDFLTSHKKDECIRKVETREQMEKQRKLTGNVQNRDHVDALEDLMEAFAAICRARPIEDVNQFLGVHHSNSNTESLDEFTTTTTTSTYPLRQLLIHAGNRLQHSYGHYVSFVELLTSLALGSESSASDVFDMMQDGEEEGFFDCNFIVFFKKMYSVTDLYSSSTTNSATTPQQRNRGRDDGIEDEDGGSIEDGGPGPLSPRVERSFRSTFRLICAVMRSPKVALKLHDQKVYMASQTSRGISSIRVLFNLLDCPLDLATKACVVDIINMFARSRPEWTQEIYQFMEIRHCFGLADDTIEDDSMVRRGTSKLPRRDFKARPFNVRYELEQMESFDKTYSLTTSTLRLLVTLGQNKPTQLGAERRVQGWWPYLNFTTNAVFSQCLRRRYQTGPRKAEKWEVSACCLAVMREILKQYDVNSSDFVRDFLGSVDQMNEDKRVYQQKSAGFMLMRSMLNPNSVILETLLAIIMSHSVEDLERAESSLAAVKLQSNLNSSKHHDRGIPENDEMLELFYAGKWLEARFERRDASNAYLHVLDLGGNVPIPIWQLGERVRRQTKWKSWKRRSVEVAMTVLDLVLSKQTMFLDNCRQHFDSAYYSSSELRIDRLRPLQKLIKSNHVVHISNFIRFSRDPCSAIPHLSTRILFHLSRFSNVSLTKSVFELLDEREILRLIAGYTARLREGLFGFVPGTPNVVTDPTLIGVFQLSSSRRPRDLPRTILELMLQSLEQKPMNLAQMLLGFKERAAILSRVSSNAQRLYDDPRARLVFNPACEDTPLHVICGFLVTPGACIEMPHLAEACFELLYQLCRSGATSITTTLYLRSYGGRNFVSHQLEQLPEIVNFVAQRFHTDDENEDTDEMCALTNVCAWILKLAALEIHLNVRAGATRLHYVHENLSKMFRFEAKNSETTTNNDTMMSQQSRMGIFEVLDKIVPVNAPPVLPPEIRRVVRNSNNNAASCVETRTYGGNEFARLNIVVLCRELDLSGTIGLSRERLRDLLAVAIRWNNIEQQIASQLHLFQAWNQFVVISFMDGFPTLEERGLCKSPIALLVRLIEAALGRIRSYPSSKPYLMEPLAEAVLMFLCKLREQIKDNPFAISIAEFRNLLKHLLLTLTHCESGNSASSSSHELRGSLYSSVLILLKLASSSSVQLLTKSTTHLETDSDETLKRRRWRQRKLLEIVQEMLNQSGEALIRLVARDSAIGLPVWRSLALSTLDALVANDGSGRCVSFLRHSGHVQRVVRFLNELPANVIGPFANVNAQREAEERMAVYDKAVSLLTRIAQNRSGCALLIQCGVMDAVRSCPAFSKAPERGESFQPDEDSKIQWLIETPVIAFRKILAPSLRLVLSLSITMPQSRSNPGQLSVLHLLKERFAVFVWCLRKALELPRPVDVDMSTDFGYEQDSKLENDDETVRARAQAAVTQQIDVLRVTDLATSILANATWNPELFEQGIGQVRSSRYASLMKALIQKLSRTPSSVRKISLMTQQNEDEGTIYDWRLRVLRNAVVFCRRQCISVTSARNDVTMFESTEMMRTELESEYFCAPMGWIPSQQTSTKKKKEGEENENVASLLDVAECVVSCSNRIEKLLSNASSRTALVSAAASRSNEDPKTEVLMQKAFTRDRDELSMLTYIVENLLSLLLLHCHYYWRKAKYKNFVPSLLSRLLQDLRVLDRRDTFVHTLLHQMRLHVRRFR